MPRLAREQAGNSDGLREDLDEILRAGDRAAGIIANLLAYSRRQLLRLAPTDLNALLARVRPGLCQTVGEAVQVRLLLAEGLPPVRIDAQRLEEGLYEMASNAAEAMPDGGTLTLETEVAPPDAAALAVAGGASPGAYVRLRVADTGIGMKKRSPRTSLTPFSPPRAAPCAEAWVCRPSTGWCGRWAARSWCPAGPRRAPPLISTCRWQSRRGGEA